jgi:hypothetical protein
MHQYNIRAVLERITIDIAKILPKETEREEISTS